MKGGEVGRKEDETRWGGGGGGGGGGVGWGGVGVNKD